MSSTDDEVTAFFREQLIAAAERLRARGVEFFARQPEHADSWWVASTQRATLERLPTGELSAKLKEIWGGQKLPELVELADALLALAESQRPAAAQSDGEVAPLIYVMF